MAAYDINAYLASGVTVTAVGRGTAVSTASGTGPPTMESVPGARAQQALIWFTGAITATSLTLVIEELVSAGVWRPLGIATFGATPAASGTWDTTSGWTADPVATYASSGKEYTQVVFQADYGVASLNYNVIAYAGGGSAVGFNCFVLPFEGSGKPVGAPA